MLTKTEHQFYLKLRRMKIEIPEALRSKIAIHRRKQQRERDEKRRKKKREQMKITAQSYRIAIFNCYKSCERMPGNEKICNAITGTLRRFSK